MPSIYRYKCTVCDLKLPSGWGSAVYAVDDEGTRQICPHPGEEFTIGEVTGMSWDDAWAAGRMGVLRDTICRACLKVFELDHDRDALHCPACRSENVAKIVDLVGHKCPNCPSGQIFREDTGIVS